MSNVLMRGIILGLALGLSAGAGQPDKVATDAPIPITFKVLAGFRVPDALFKAKPGKVLRYLPKSILSLDGQRVVLTGYLLPTRMHNRKAVEFMVLRTQNTCCYGVPPEVNEVVEVPTIATPADPLMDVVVRVTGRLHVKERWEGTYLCSIYQMDAESVALN